eukprot:1158866-Pelagomonas_calceolata.AAC.7
MDLGGLVLCLAVVAAYVSAWTKNAFWCLVLCGGDGWHMLVPGPRMHSGALHCVKVTAGMCKCLDQKCVSCLVLREGGNRHAPSVQSVMCLFTYPAHRIKQPHFA